MAKEVAFLATFGANPGLWPACEGPVYRRVCVTAAGSWWRRFPSSRLHSQTGSTCLCSTLRQQLKFPSGFPWWNTMSIFRTFMFFCWCFTLSNLTEADDGSKSCVLFQMWNTCSIFKRTNLCCWTVLLCKYAHLQFFILVFSNQIPWRNRPLLKRPHMLAKQS